MTKDRARPIVVFVDDEPHNLTVFEAAMPDDWDVFTFSNPLEAFEKMADLDPNVIASDQRMPGLSGVKLLELAGRLCPNAVRILITGYSDEDLVIDSVRLARVFDYVRKPWDVDDLIKRLEAALNHNELITEREVLTAELKRREEELNRRNTELTVKSAELDKAFSELQAANRELLFWVPPVVTWLTQNKLKFPVRKNLAVIAIDIIGSGAYHGVSVGQKSLRAIALAEFSLLVLKHGGFVESTEGDAAYANFGLTGRDRVCDAALAVAIEFQAALQGISTHHHVGLECGIGLHYAEGVEADVSELSISSLDGHVVQKRFYTASIDVDLVHRMEKHVHSLSGSHIVASKSFLDNLGQPLRHDPIDIGYHRFKGQSKSAKLYLIAASPLKNGELAIVMGSDHSSNAETEP